MSVTAAPTLGKLEAVARSAQSSDTDIRPLADTFNEEAPKSVYCPNCKAVRSAGADPIRIGQPGYGSHLDRDDDGAGCE
ncbi:excalibur calcium-binding domain-containing protein [Tessaracoccus flavescens]|uniref:excalibur calcium-binding domain-containing protein n=1 Tax=Tessaracoccus flavescens TaxID=399497 RepID=UPI001F1D5141|nr:excalibur calcium-binding domain-containing protein [Tessaracoccus flavescens]